MAHRTHTVATSLVGLIVATGFVQGLSADVALAGWRLFAGLPAVVSAASAEELPQTQALDTSKAPIGSTPRPVDAKVLSVRIRGTHAVTEEQARQWADIEPGAAWGVAQAEEHIRRLLVQYRRSGYAWARVDSVVTSYNADSTAVQVELWVEEGPLTRTGDIVVNGVDQEWARRIMARFDSRPGRPFLEDLLQQDLQEALEAFDNGGYPFAQVVLDSLALRSEEGSRLLDVHLSAYPGPEVRLQEIRVIGAVNTKSEVIVRASGLRLGQRYNRRSMVRVPARLKRLPFIESAGLPVPFVSESGLGGVLLQVRERKASSIDGVLGYNPALGSQKGYLTGLLDLSLGNLFGTARALQARWQKRDRRTQELRLAYMEPWVLGSPLSLGGAFEQLVQDTTYVRRDLTLDFSLPLADWLSARVQLGHSEVLPDSLATALYGMPRSKAITIAAGLAYDTRDDPLNPRSGLCYRTDLFVDRKKQYGSASQLALYGLRSKVDNRRVVVDTEFYLQTFRYQVMAVALHGRQVTSNQGKIPLEDQFRFGGARTMRGYRENEFRGARVAWVNLEYRYLLGRRSRAFIFLDSGYYWREDIAHQATEGYRLGYGCGVRIETGLGVVGVDVGLGKGDSLLEAKLHVGLLNEF